MALQSIVEFCLSFFPPSIGILTGVVAALLADPRGVLRLLSGQVAYTPDTYKNYPTGINELRNVLINGARHAVLIRGCDANKPVLLVLHGGPGATDIPFHRAYGQYLEMDFVVVHYDQRGSCKSASLNKDIPNFDDTITIDQHIDDAIGITTWLTNNSKFTDAKNGLYLLGGRNNISYRNVSTD
jgi:predicted alpha/beta-fold hydrolase